MKKFLVAVAFCALVFSSFSCSQLADDFSEEATPSYSSTGKSAAANTQSSNSTADTKSESKNASGSTESADSEAPSNNAAEEEVTETEQNAKNAENTVKEEENKNASDTTQSEEQQKAADNTAEEKTEQAEQKANGETPSDTSSGSKSPASSGSTPRENPQPKPSFNPPKSQTSGDSTNGSGTSSGSSKAPTSSGSTPKDNPQPSKNTNDNAYICKINIDDSEFKDISCYDELHSLLVSECRRITSKLYSYANKNDANNWFWSEWNTIAGNFRDIAARVNQEASGRGSSNGDGYRYVSNVIDSQMNSAVIKYINS